MKTKTIAWPIFLFFFSLSIDGITQRANSIWLFGEGCGLDFNSGEPTVRRNSQLIGPENSAVLTDSSGQLLFYSNGESIWDRSHRLIQNGSDLLGHNSSRNGVVIIPNANDENQYYLFTVSSGEQQPARDIRYSMVDLSLNSGRGGVIPETKNTLVASGFAENIYAVPGNCDTVWLVSMIWEDASIMYAFPVTVNGVGEPVISEYPLYRTIYQAIDQTIMMMKEGWDVFSINEFDVSTGRATPTFELSLGEFTVKMCLSPDHSKVYAITHSQKLFQFDLSTGNQTGIQASRTQIGTVEHFFPGDMRIGPDEKIYIVSSSALSVINQPNELGLACDYEPGILSLRECRQTGNLPNPVVYPRPLNKPQLLDTFICKNDTVNLVVDSIYDSYSWSTGHNGLSIDVTLPGLYSIEVSKDNCTLRDTSEIKGWIPVDDIFGNDTLLCEGEELILDITDPNAVDYLWSDGNANAIRVIAEPAVYWAQTSDEFCNYRDFIEVMYQYFPFSLGMDTFLCQGETLLLDVQIPNGRYTWNDGSRQATLLVDSPGRYEVMVEAQHCQKTTDIQIGYYPALGIDLGMDTVYCEEDNPVVLLDAFNPAVESYFWNTMATTAAIEIEESGVYEVEITDGNCWAKDEIAIDLYRCTPCDFYVPNAFSPNDDGINDQFVAFPTCNLLNFQMHIFDRWGNLLFETKDHLNGWDGKVNSIPLTNGVFVYAISYEVEENGELLQRKKMGDVIILR